MRPSSFCKLWSYFPFFMVYSFPTCYTFFPSCKWWRLHIQYKAIVMIYMWTVHPLDMSSSMFIVNSLRGVLKANESEKFIWHKFKRTYNNYFFHSWVHTFGNATFLQIWHISSGYRLTCFIRKDTAGSKLGLLTNGGAFGLGFLGASTHWRANSFAFSTNHTLKTRGKLLSVSDIL